MSDVPLLDYGERLKQRGMALAECAQEWSSPGSTEEAFLALVAVARRQATVHANDLRHVRLERPNAWGSVWARAIREGIIERTNEVRPCSDPLKHKHNSPLYASLIYRRGGAR